LRPALLVLRFAPGVADGSWAICVTGRAAGSPAAAFTFAARFGRFAMLSPFHVFLFK
jgi:hypothetical protein